MPRGYYKARDVKYGRPGTRIVSEPPSGFKIYDTGDWDDRRFVRELVKRQLQHDWEKQRGEWSQEPGSFEGEWYRSEERTVAPGLRAGGRWDFRGLTPPTDLDEINAFLCRPPPVSQIDSAEKADHALRLGIILIAVDPNTPDLAKRIGTEAEKIRQTHPLLVKKSHGRPSKSGNIGIINPAILNAWRVHRIVELHELRLKGYDPRKERKQIAAWLYPEQKNQHKRGEMLDRAVDLLDGALTAARAIDAQTR
jgi:hypothetical protein